MGYESEKSIVNELHNHITNGVFENEWEKYKIGHDNTSLYEQYLYYFIERAINNYIENYGGDSNMFSGEIKKQVFRKLLGELLP